MKRDTEALAAQIDTLRNDLSEVTSLLTEMGLRRRDETVAAAKERVDALRREGSERLHDAQRRATDAQDQVLESIRRQPGTAMGIAVAVGFLAGLLTSRR
ncbi:DUF883 family protein [Roseivivax isoporae]|nr:DUF883 family protein [Roseivivax isoporae]